jgi:hypothetical protein
MIRRPIVRTIRHPPSDVPSVMATPQATFVQSGTVKVSSLPEATSNAAITPIDFCASFAPWLNESAPDIPHSAPRIGPCTRRVARRSARLERRTTQRPKTSPITGETARAIRTPKTPTGFQPSRPPQRTASSPPSATAEPTSPPTSAWLELEGNPRDQVRTFQSVAASAPAPMTTTACSAGTVTMPAIVSATAEPTSSAPSMLKTAESAIAGPGPAPRVATSVAMAFAAS